MHRRETARLRWLLELQFGETKMNNAEKVLISYLIVALTATAFVIGNVMSLEKIVTKEVVKLSTHIFVWDKLENTLYISGGTSDNPITWSEIKRLLLAVGAKPNYTIISNSSIVIDKMFTAKELQELLDSLGRGKP